MSKVQSVVMAVLAVCVAATGCAPKKPEVIAGYYDVSIKAAYEQNLFGGKASFEVPTNLDGKWELELDPETQQFTKFSGELKSDPESILDAQYRRIGPYFQSLREKEFNLYVRQQELVNEGFRDAWGVVSKAIDVLGPQIVTSVVSSGLSSGLDFGAIANLLDQLMQAQAIIPKVTQPTP